MHHGVLDGDRLHYVQKSSSLSVALIASIAVRIPTSAMIPDRDDQGRQYLSVTAATDALKNDFNIFPEGLSEGERLHEEGVRRAPNVHQCC